MKHIFRINSEGKAGVEIPIKISFSNKPTPIVKVLPMIGKPGEMVVMFNKFGSPELHIWTGTKWEIP